MVVTSCKKYYCYFSNVVAIVHNELWWLKAAKNTVRVQYGHTMANLGTSLSSCPPPPLVANHTLDRYIYSFIKPYQRIVR